MRSLKNYLQICMLLCPSFLLAQQLPIFSLYQGHWGLINPAGVSSNYITQENNISLNASVRQQWVKIPEAPKTQILSFQYIDDQNYNVAFGGHFINDQTGAFGQMGLYGNLAYRIPIGGRYSGNILAGGLSFGAVQYRTDFAEILSGTTSVSGLSLNDLDKLSNSNKLFFDAGLGLMLYLGGNTDQQNFYIGIASPQTFNLNTSYRTLAGDFTIVRTRHLYANAGAYFFKSRSRSNSRDLSYFEVNLLGGYVPDSPLTIDANIRYQFQNRFWGGIGGGLSKVLHVEGGVQLGLDRPIRLGIAYNQFIGKLNTSFGQSFEVSVSYSRAKFK